MKFYHILQNNSGGGFDFDEVEGLTHNIVIEATSADEANDKALRIGCYFDGVSGGSDCPCCGDRWSPVQADDGEDFPHLFGRKLGEYRESRGYQWMKDGRETAVHYADGWIEWYNADNTRAEK